MKKVEATIQQSKLVEVKEALRESGVDVLTITTVHRAGGEGHTFTYRGVRRKVDIAPSARIEAIVADRKVDAVIDTIVRHARTGSAADGTIVVSDLDRVVQIRTGEIDGPDNEFGPELRPQVAAARVPSRWDVPSYQHSW